MGITCKHLSVYNTPEDLLSPIFLPSNPVSFWFCFFVSIPSPNVYGRMPLSLSYMISILSQMICLYFDIICSNSSSTCMQSTIYTLLKIVSMLPDLFCYSPSFLDLSLPSLSIYSYYLLYHMLADCMHHAPLSLSASLYFLRRVLSLVLF